MYELIRHDLNFLFIEGIMPKDKDCKDKGRCNCPDKDNCKDKGKGSKHK